MFKKLIFILFKKWFDHKGEYTMSEQSKDSSVETENASPVVEQPTPAPADETATASDGFVVAPEDGVSRPTVDDVPVAPETELAQPAAPAIPAVEQAPAPVVITPVADTPVAVPEEAPVVSAAPAVAPSTDSDKTEGEPDTHRFDLLASALKSLLQEAGHDLDEAFDDAVPLAKEIASSDEEFGHKLNGILVVVGREYGEAFHKFFNYAKKHI
jgi:hypothetical protein